MGKHKHSKDKLYILQSEYRRDALIKKQLKAKSVTYLPFNYCCLSLKPFSDPYCDEDGRLYDKKSVLEEMSRAEEKDKKKCTVDIKNLIKANFYKHNNQYICPITRKYFNQHTKIILNKKTGNVYSSEIYKLFQNKNEMFDPISHDSMNKSDFIVLQDPLNKRNDIFELNKNFVQKKKKKTQSIQENGAIMNILQEVNSGKVKSQKVQNEETQSKEALIEGTQSKNFKGKQSEGEGKQTYTRSRTHHKDETKNEMQLGKKGKYFYSSHTDNNNSEEESSENEIKIKCVNYSDNKLAQSVTSTISDVTYKNSFIYLSESQVYDLIYDQVKTNKKNSYVRLITDIGMINVELYAPLYPKLCHNFLFLCEYKYYNRTHIFKKDKKDVIVYFGSSKNNYHSAMSGFYWRKKLKKKKLRKKINDENVIHSFKELIMNINSDDDSDRAIKYVKHQESRHTEAISCYGNIYFFKYYNQKYSNMFYICLSEEYVTSDVCFGRVVGGNETLGKLKNLDPTISGNVQYTLNEAIIYTNPFKDAVKEMKEKIKKKEEKNDAKENTESFIDDVNFVENKNDSVGKYIKWTDFKKSNQSTNNELNKTKEHVLQKEMFSKSKQSKMDFSCW
ncbi:peptidyl-prolyl cis-trans isomerase, putative [Plasmodium malariae]|uniref:Peptidyl-prolyl cis-trans isomerase, putative n=1 Tax=Plasmodium malariae TaxID=5858 RepID=A0A1C3KBX9_PLAMA|nr:peptidyl-prolyl cis-trans isomerase, putative [Plasmodium malariae]